MRPACRAALRAYLAAAAASSADGASLIRAAIAPELLAGE